MNRFGQNRIASMHFYLFSTAYLCVISALALQQNIFSFALVFHLSAALLIGIVCKLRQDGLLERSLQGVFLLGLCGAAAVRIAAIIIRNAANPPEWDFLCYWVYSLAARTGAEFYRSRIQFAGSLPVTPSDTFTSELLGTPFHFPPPAAFLYAWLSAFDYRTAALIWMSLLAAAFFVCAMLLAHLMKGSEHSRLLPPAILGCLGPTAETFSYCQTNFFLLLCVLAFWLRRRRAAGGAVLGAGALVIKPIAALFLLHSLFTRSVAPILGALITGAALFISSAAVFGWTNVAAYFVSDLPNALPSEMYVQEINQSLLAATLRVTDYDYQGGSPLLSPVFIAVAFLLTAATAGLCAARPARMDDYAVCAVLLLALLCYPGTLTHYSVLLVLPLTAAVLARDDAAPTLVLLIMTLTAVDSWKTGTLALLICWSWAVRPLAREALARRRQPETVLPASRLEPELGRQTAA